MDKLEYDSLHKFLVSLGVIFIALPFVVLYFVFSNDVILISQIDFDGLSQYSQNLLQQQSFLWKIVIIVLPIACVLLFVAGIILLVTGITNWKKVQKNLDAVIEADRIRHELENEKMKNSEIFEKTTEEVRENELQANVSEHSAIIKHLDIEDRYFAKVVNEWPVRKKRRYSFLRNIKIGKYEYDGVAVSTMDNIDLIYEIKYWKQPRTIQMLRTSLERLYRAGANYETLKHRNFTCVFAIIAPEAILPSMKRWVESLSHEGAEYDISKIQIQYVAEETI